jgi:hypothetical protein
MQSASCEAGVSFAVAENELPISAFVSFAARF